MILSRSILALMLCCVGGSAHADNPWPDAFERRNYRLGVTLAEFRAAKHPDQREWPNAYPVCSGEPRATKYPFSDIGTSDVWVSAGVTKCEFFYDSTHAKRTSTYGAGLVLGDLNASTEFYFLADPKDAEPRLMLIVTSGPVASYDDLVLTFEAALGKPTVVTSDKLQNAMGAEFENRVVRWETASSTIEASRYGDTVRKFKIDHTLKPLWSVFNQRLDEKRAEAAKKL